MNCWLLLFETGSFAHSKKPSLVFCDTSLASFTRSRSEPQKISFSFRWCKFRNSAVGWQISGVQNLSWYFSNIEPKNGGGWKMIFLFNWVIFRFHVNFLVKTTLGIQSPNVRGWARGVHGVQSHPKRKVFRFHETILSFGEPGSLRPGLTCLAGTPISIHPCPRGVCGGFCSESVSQTTFPPVNGWICHSREESIFCLNET